MIGSPTDSGVAVLQCASSLVLNGIQYLCSRQLAKDRNREWYRVYQSFLSVQWPIVLFVSVLHCSVAFRHSWISQFPLAVQCRKSTGDRPAHRPWMSPAAEGSSWWPGCSWVLTRPSQNCLPLPGTERMHNQFKAWLDARDVDQEWGNQKDKQIKDGRTSNMETASCSARASSTSYPSSLVP